MSEVTACPYCHQTHAGKCALVKAFEYHPDGSIKRVEFYAPSDYVPAIFANPAPQNNGRRSLRDVRIT
jgi:hypothetical protein